MRNLKKGQVSYSLHSDGNEACHGGEISINIIPGVIHTSFCSLPTAIGQRFWVFGSAARSLALATAKSDD